MKQHFQLHSAIIALLISSISVQSCNNTARERLVTNFCEGWKFNMGDVSKAGEATFNDSAWRKLNLPHDWSIEGTFSKDYPAGVNGGALPGGIGWYRKSFAMPETEKGKQVFIDFDGVYRNSEVWINGHYLGIRPYGYSSFRYELTPYLNFGSAKNVIAVKVDNSQQPNSRWYSGSGIYRNVWLVVTNKLFVDHWGTAITTPEVTDKSSKVSIVTKVRNANIEDCPFELITTIYNAEGKNVASIKNPCKVLKDSVLDVSQEILINSPSLWSIESPYLYKAISQITQKGKVVDSYETNFGIRYFNFDRDKGFTLNGKPIKIKGVCNHHDLGCLGSAINTRAIERQLEILKAMGCNGIRTSHNPPAPELLDLCDKMGFIVMDEAFDMWKIAKTKYDYHLDFDKWHKRDLEDMVIRDRNHPCIFIWSIGNEVSEQVDWTEEGTLTKDLIGNGIPIAKELAGIVKNLDKTRPVTSGLNFPSPDNFIVKSGALDLIGFNYDQNSWPDYLKKFPGQKFIGSETTSALQSRGHYDQPSDIPTISYKLMKADEPTPSKDGTYSCSGYDNLCGEQSTHEESWKLIKKYDFLSGMYIWTGFDYLGEPNPYPWPARSAYFGIIDLAGFPKDVYYMYQSEWTSKPMLHIFPHWNWKQGDSIDVWAYSNCQEVELFLNGKSLGTKNKKGDELHLMWRVAFAPGALKAIARSDGKEILTQEIKTAGKPAKILLVADRQTISADGKDLSFVTVSIVDKDGVLVPNADNLVKFNIEGDGTIAGVDNGYQISHEPFKASYRKAYNGLCLAVVQAKRKSGNITLTAVSEGLEKDTIRISTWQSIPNIKKR